jgi:hypothetical protein
MTRVVRFPKPYALLSRPEQENKTAAFFMHKRKLFGKNKNGFRKFSQ